MSASIRIILVVQALHLTAAATAHAEATVTETPTIVVVENDSVKLTFAVPANYVPTELASKRGSGKNRRPSRETKVPEGSLRNFL